MADAAPMPQDSAAAIPAAPPRVSSGSVTVDADGAFVWSPDPAVAYSDLWCGENGVRRRLTTDEAAILAAPQAQPRVLIRKSTVYGRLKALGRVPALLQAFSASPQLAYEWNMPGWPNIYADEPALLATLQAIGCGADEVAQVTAPDPLGPAPEAG